MSKPKYDVEKFEKNAMIIFNYVTIAGFEPRTGSDKDISALMDTFVRLGFEVEEYEERDKKDLIEELRAFAKKDFSSCGCVAVAVLSHGNDQGQLRARDQFFSEAEILNELSVRNNPTLKGKPRLAIIQADGATKSGITQLEPDTLVLHSPISGKAKNTASGSWLVQTLCKKISALTPATDMETIFNEVKNSAGPEGVPIVYSKVTKGIYFMIFDMA